MAGAALIVELAFSILGLVPPQYDAAASKSNLRWLRVPATNRKFFGRSLYSISSTNPGITEARS
jgi:hypothetical protein